MKSYYLLRDGKTIVGEHPGVRVKSVARAANKKEAVKVFNARFEKVEGVYTDRKPGATPRRVSIVDAEAERKPKAATPAPGSKICFCIDPDCGCPRAGDPGSEVHMPLPSSVRRATSPESKIGAPAEALDDSDPILVESREGEGDAADRLRALLGGTMVHQQTFHFRDVSYTIPVGTKVTLTSKGEIILQASEKTPEPPTENEIDLIFQGKP